VNRAETEFPKDNTPLSARTAFVDLDLPARKRHRVRLCSEPYFRSRR
jgi:hypothetical protein